jgi:hypothetical protein
MSIKSRKIRLYAFLLTRLKWAEQIIEKYTNKNVLKLT